jgi:hypothetical protein
MMINMPNLAILFGMIMTKGPLGAEMISCLRTKYMKLLQGMENGVKYV